MSIISYADSEGTDLSKNKLYIFDLIDNLRYGSEHGDARKDIYQREKIQFVEKRDRENILAFNNLVKIHYSNARTFNRFKFICFNSLPVSILRLIKSIKDKI